MPTANVVTPMTNRKVHPMTNNEEIDAAWAEMKRLAAQLDAIYPGSGTELALRFVQATIEGLRQLRGVVTHAANIKEFDEAFAEMKRLAAQADATEPGSGTRMALYGLPQGIALLQAEIPVKEAKAAAEAALGMRQPPDRP